MTRTLGSNFAANSESRIESEKNPSVRVVSPDSRTLLIHITLLLVSTVISVLVAEAIARVVTPRAISYPWMDSLYGITVPLPNVHGRHFVPGSFDTSFSFNAQRFRGTQVLSPEPGPTSTRIAVLGSSFTFGSGANDDETYPLQLQQLLQRKAEQRGSGSTFEVINAGIPGSVVADEALWYHAWVRRFHPQLVILNVACVVDFATTTFAINQQGKLVPRPIEQQHSSRDESLHHVLRRLPGYIFLSQHSELFNLLVLNIGQSVRRKSSSVPDEFNTRSSSSHVEELKRALWMESEEVAWLNDDVKKSGAQLALIALPCHENVDSTATPDATEIRREYLELVNMLQHWAAQEQVPFLNLAPALRSTARVSTRPLFYEGRLETHPTPAGYRAIASSVAQFLYDSDLVPNHNGSR